MVKVNLNPNIYKGTYCTYFQPIVPEKYQLLRKTAESLCLQWEWTQASIEFHQRCFVSQETPEFTLKILFIVFIKEMFAANSRGSK